MFFCRQLSQCSAPLIMEPMSVSRSQLIQQRHLHSSRIAPSCFCVILLLYLQVLLHLQVTEPQLAFGGCKVFETDDIYEEEDVTTPWLGATRSLKRTRDTFESIMAAPAHTLMEANMPQPVTMVNINQRELTDTNALLSQVKLNAPLH